MAKIDKSLYTKEEFRALKEAKRQAKLGNTNTSYTFDRNDDYSQVYILCLKHGKKYSVDYVNKLYSMCKRHCKLDFKFACLTDDPMGLDPNILVLDLPPGLNGWWCKPYMFSKDLPIKGTILYMDLDVVVSSSIDKLIAYQPDHWCTIRDFTRAMRPKWPKYNSSIVRFKTGQLHFVWEEYIKDPNIVQRKHFGDQDYLYEATSKMKAILYPDSWIQSWKWEVRKSKEFSNVSAAKGSRTFKKIETVTPRIECCVCVFHGDPNPHNCEDPWVVENWR